MDLLNDVNRIRTFRMLHLNTRRSTRLVFATKIVFRRTRDEIRVRTKRGVFIRPITIVRGEDVFFIVVRLNSVLPNLLLQSSLTIHNPVLLRFANTNISTTRTIYYKQNLFLYNFRYTSNNILHNGEGRVQRGFLDYFRFLGMFVRHRFAHSYFGDIVS